MNSDLHQLNRRLAIWQWGAMTPEQLSYIDTSSSCLATCMVTAAQVRAIRERPARSRLIHIVPPPSRAEREYRLARRDSLAGGETHHSTTVDADLNSLNQRLAGWKWGTLDSRQRAYLDGAGACLAECVVDPAQVQHLRANGPSLPVGTGALATTVVARDYLEYLRLTALAILAGEAWRLASAKMTLAQAELIATLTNAEILSLASGAAGQIFRIDGTAERLGAASLDEPLQRIHATITTMAA